MSTAQPNDAGVLAGNAGAPAGACAAASLLATRRRRAWIAFFTLAGVVTVAGFALRWRFLDYPMRYDESFFYLRFGAKTPWYIVTHFATHCLHTLMVRVAIPLLGNSPAALRSPAFLAGVMLIPLTGWLSWSLFRHRTAALLAMLAACVSSHLVEYSTNARGYTWLVVFATLAAICTIRLMERPAGRRLWIVWGALGAIGAYTHVAMIFPMAVLGVALVIQLLRSRRGGADRRALFRGLVLGSVVSIVATMLLYLPILAVEGTITAATYTKLARQIYQGYLDENGQMLVAAWRCWIRHTNVVWQGALAIGFGAFLVSSFRRPSPRHLVPIGMLLFLPALVVATRTPMVPPGWLFALPLFLACSMYGLCALAELFRGKAKTIVAAAVVSVATLSATASLVTLGRQSYLSTWDYELVDIEQILAECDRFGTDRCALMIRHTPAKAYYQIRREMAPLRSTTEPSTTRVYIAACTLETLDDLWHEGVEGFELFGPPKLVRRFPRSTLYAADRLVGADAIVDSAG